MSIEPGIYHEMVIVVEEKDTARASGEETLPAVLSTPCLIGFLEHTAHQAILSYLAESQTTVGTKVNLHHMAATPVGMKVRFRAELVEVDRRRLNFRIEAWDAIEKVAEGKHERFIIDQVRFNERLAKKITADLGD